MYEHATNLADVNISIRVQLELFDRYIPILVSQGNLKSTAVDFERTLETDDPERRAMQFYHVFCVGFVMEPVDVLSDKVNQLVFLF